MHHLIYISQATRPLNERELAELLRQARQRNVTRQITGALVYGKEQFMQVLEGEKAIVAAVYQLILADARHRNVLKLVDKPIAQRNFLTWSMAFQVVSDTDFARLKGYVAPEQLHEHAPAPGHNATDAVLSAMMRDLIQPAFP